MPGVPRRAAAFVYVVCFFAVALLALSFLRADAFTARFWTNLGLLTLVYALCASLMTRSSAAVGVSLGFVVGMATVLLCGPAGGGVVGLAAAVQVHRGGLPLMKRAFNGAQFSLAGIAAGWVLSLVGGPSILDLADTPRLLGATLLIVAVYYLVNNVLLSLVVAMATGARVRAVFWESISWLTISYLAYGLLGLAMAVLWQVSIVAGLLVLVPVLVARWAFAQYAAEQQAYGSTVAALCQAVETKDLYTRGHSERVSLGSVLIARQLGMREDRVGAIRYAGMLHDVGKLGVPTRVLQKSGHLTQEEFDAIKLHPVRGFEMLRGIDFLSEALAGIIHHHERLDGRGYPMGLKGQDIPEFARIIAVADALDAMTSTRSYRAAKSVDEALAEIRASAGAQFDPAMVEAVEHAVARHGWSTQRRADDHQKPVGVASMGEVLLADDHDLVDDGRTP
ncbi:MAG: hypothetical protein QOJ92_1962 [Frankiales bacterium]|jgi:hypothetical protein|nr:hypothetical protein [Frankiales bacterium]